MKNENNLDILSYLIVRKIFRQNLINFNIFIIVNYIVIYDLVV